MHRSIHLLSGAFGGSWGRVEPFVGPLPERERLALGEVTLDLLRWPGPGQRKSMVRPPPPLLLLHGLNNNAWIWARLAVRLQASREVAAVSLHGHGQSSAPAEGYPLSRTTADLGELLDRLVGECWAGPAILAGHSWGGKVACHLAATFPQRFAALILADPVLPQGLNPVLRRFPGLMLAAFRPERGPFASRADWQTGASRLIYLRQGDDLDRRIWEESFVEQQDGSFVHRLPEPSFREILLRTLAEDITPLLARLTCPVLLLRPTCTVSFWPGELGPLRRTVARLEERRIAGDHTFIHTNPLDTTTAIAGFLQRSGC